MVKMTKMGKTKFVDDSDVKGQIKNGWAVAEQDEIRAVLRKPKKDTEDTPAVEDDSEQGENDEANKGD